MTIKEVFKTLAIKKFGTNLLCRTDYIDNRTFDECRLFFKTITNPIGNLHLFYNNESNEVIELSISHSQQTIDCKTLSDLENALSRIK